MDEMRTKVISVGVAIQREQAYRKRFAALNMLPDEELIPLQIPNSSSKSTVTAVKQAAAPSYSEQPSENASARSISSWNPNVLGERRPAPTYSEQPSANASARSISSWNANVLGERQSAPPNNGELSGVKASPMQYPRPNSGPMRERRPAQNSQEIPGGTASSNPSLLREKPPAMSKCVLNACSRTIAVSNPNPRLLGGRPPTTSNNVERPTGYASSNPSLLREKPPAMSNIRQLPVVDACPRPIAVPNASHGLLGGRPPTTSNNVERPTGYASSRPIASSNTSLAGQKRPAVPNNHELLMGNSSSRPSLIEDPLSSRVDQSVHSTQALPLQLVSSFSQNDKLMPKPDYLFCEVCKVQCSGRLNYEQHVKGRKHRLKVEELKFGIKDMEEDSAVGSQRARKWCSLCRVWCMNDDNMKMHLTGQKHKAEEARLMLAQTGGMIENQKYCDLSGIECSDDRALQMHFNEKRRKTELSLRECGRKTGQNSKHNHCELCNIYCTDERGLQSHLEGNKHALKVLEAKKRGWLVPVDD